MPKLSELVPEAVPAATVREPVRSQKITRGSIGTCDGLYYMDAIAAGIGCCRTGNGVDTLKLNLQIAFTVDCSCFCKSGPGLGDSGSVEGQGLAVPLDVIVICAAVLCNGSI